MKTREPFYVLVILLLLGLAWYQWDSARDEQMKRLLDNGKAQVSIAKHEATALRARARGDSLQASFEIRHAKDSLALKGLKIENSRMSARAKKLREPVQSIIDSLPALRAFVLANDSLLMAKDAMIQDMALRHSGQIIDLQQQLKERGREIIENAGTIADLKEEIVNAQAGEKKAKRGKRFWQVVGGVLAAGIIYQSVK